MDPCEIIEREECIICYYDKPIEDYICFSCGHKVCATCYPLMRNICPICRYRDDDILQIQVVVPTHVPENLPRNNYQRMIITGMCSSLCIMAIYLVIVIPIQNSIN
jgi:hypothetical protein